MAKSKSKPAQETTAIDAADEPISLIRDGVAVYLNEHDRWKADKSRAFVDDTYADAIENMIDIAEEAEEIQPEDKGLVVAIKSLAEEWARYNDERNANGAVSPRNSLWQARERLVAVFLGKDKPKQQFPPLEKIADLAKQNVSHLQIAKIYGFTREDGTPLLHLVQKELDHPGCVINTPGGMDGETWEDPRVKRQRLEQERLGELTKSVQRRREIQQEQKNTKAPCRETPRELYDQRVSVRQASRMLQMTELEVQNLFDSFQAEDQLATAEA